MELSVVTFLFGLIYTIAGFNLCSKEEIGIECITVNRGLDYQWAACVPRRGSADSKSYEWVTCMDVIGSNTPTTVSLCKCDKAVSFLTSQLPIDNNCFSVLAENCGWYEDCLENYGLCTSINEAHVRSIGTYFCQLSVNNYALSRNGRNYLSQVGHCIQRALFPLILPGTDKGCSERLEILIDTMTNCYTATSTLFSSLDFEEQMLIVWSSRNLSLTGILDPLRNLINNATRNNVKELVITVAVKPGEITDVFEFMERFALRSEWNSKGIMWDSKLTRSDKSSFDISIIIAFAPKLMKNSSRLLDLNQELNSIERKMVANELDELSVLQVIVPENVLKQNGRLTPLTPQEIGITFTLFSKRTGNGHKLEPEDVLTFQTFFYRRGRDTVIIIHGYGDNDQSPWVTSLREVLLEQNDINVITVNWGKNTSGVMTYPQAVASTVVVGYATSFLITMLQINLNAKMRNIHIIGHGLGAHAAGFAGSFKFGRIGRITGLDPAGFHFKQQPPENRLDAGDAKFVDVIHTDALGIGMELLSGDVDFFPDGGILQPGCNWITNVYLKCSHNRATSLLIESIRVGSRCSFIACKCSETEFNEKNCYLNSCFRNSACTSFGYNVDRNTRGLYFLNTFRRKPYCTGRCPGDMTQTIFDFISPENLDDIEPIYYLFTRKNMNGSGEILNLNDTKSIDKSNFDGNKKTIFIIHGFQHSVQLVWVQTMKAALVEKFDVNVILVDWEKASNKPIKGYDQAVVNTQVIANNTCLLIRLLRDQAGVSMSDVHLIGHSLGAHLSGFVGSYCDGEIGRITGLDPAGLQFADNNARIRLDERDALFVDVIHTDTYGIFGSATAIGHVDFYPNGGRYQPGCSGFVCSHFRAYRYYIESIMSSCEFTACKCTEEEYNINMCNPVTGSENITCTAMGYEADVTARGSHYLDIKPDFPFCTGKYPGLA